MHQPSNPSSDDHTTADASDPLPTPALPSGPLDQLTEAFHLQTTFPTAPAAKGTSNVLPSAVYGYEILGILGRGGMGVVYKARQLKLNRLVALKMILAGEHASADALERFRAEAESEARLQHPNIVQVYEIGDHQGHPYFSLEFVDGGSLAQKLAGTPLSPPEAAHLVETLARAMDYAHQQHIIHRDLKPANVLLTQDGIPKIADFGLAKQLEGDSTNTRTGAVVGTPSYMAPEQATGHSKNVGPLADVYALGAILYEYLTGRPPFKAATPLETVLQVVMDEPVPPVRLQPKTPRDLETICLKCLEKQPARRYASARLLAEDLRRFRAGEPIEARPVSVVEQGVKWAKRRPAVAGLLGTLTALTAAAILLLTLAWQNANTAWGKAEEARQGEEQHRKKVEQEKQHKEDALQQVKDEKEKTDDALKKEEQLRRDAEAARKAEAEQRHQFQRLSVGLLLDRSASLAAQDDPARGLLWATRALQLAGKEDADLEHAIRLNLAGLGAPLHTLRLVISQTPPIRSVTFSPDGKLLLTCGEHTILWDADSGELIRELPHRGTVYQAVFSLDGSKIATAGADRTARLWDTDSGKPLGELKHPEGVTRVTFADDGKLLATTCTDFTVHLWDIGMGKEVCEPMKHEGQINALTASPKGGKLLLTASNDKTARLWDTAGKQVAKLEHTETVFAAVFSPNGELIATASVDRTARLWKTATGEQQGEPLRHNETVYNVAFSPNGQYLLTGSADKTARLWKVTTGEPSRLITHAGEVIHVAFGKDRFVTGGSDQTARVYDVATGKQIGAPLPHQNTVRFVAFSPDGKKVLTRCVSGLIRVWDPEAPTLTARSLGRNYSPVGIAISSDGELLAQGTTDGKARLWKIGATKPIALARDPLELKGAVHTVAFSRDGKTMLTGGGDKQLRLWDVETGELRGEALKTDVPVHAAALSDDGTTILAAGNRSANLYEVATGIRRNEQPMTHPSNVWCVALSPDGKIAATGGEDGVVRLWDGRTGKSLDRNLIHRGEVRALAFSRDGRYLLTGSEDRTARLWDVMTGKPATAPLAHQRNVNAVAISPDGKTLLTGSQDGRAQLWDAATGKPIGPPTVHAFAVRAVAFSPDGKTYLSTTNSTVLRDVKVLSAADGDVERLVRWSQVLTGLELDDDGTIGALDGPKWREGKARLDKLGGAPP